jgi:hypothetical protein
MIFRQTLPSKFDTLHGVFHVLRGPKPQDVETHLLLLLHIFYPAMQCNCSPCNVPPDTELQKRANFSTLIVDLAETGDQNRAAGAARSSITDCAIHYDIQPAVILQA